MPLLQRGVGCSVSGGGGNAKRGDGAARSMVTGHSETAAARWQQQGGCGGFTSTIRECANARAFERLQPSRCALPPRFALAAAADAATTAAAVPPPSYRQRRAVTLPPPPLTLPLSEIASCASCASMAL